MIQIIIGSTLGGTEYVAEHMSELLQGWSFETTMHYHPILSDIPNSGIWLIITSTFGAGDYPDNIKPFIKALQETQPHLKHVKYAVIAIGDSSYDTFCFAGKDAHNLLKEKGAIAISDCLTIDIQTVPFPETQAENHLKKLRLHD